MILREDFSAWAMQLKSWMLQCQFGPEPTIYHSVVVSCSLDKENILTTVLNALGRQPADDRYESSRGISGSFAVSADALTFLKTDLTPRVDAHD